MGDKNCNLAISAGKIQILFDGVENYNQECVSSGSNSSSEPVEACQGHEAEHTRKHRRKRKRKWKPYTELSWDERQQLDDRETKRAYAKREKLSAEGHPIAPYNTTQFLMDEHKQNTPDLREADRADRPLTSTCNYSATTPSYSAENVTSVNSGREIDSYQQYIMEDFSHTYADVHAQHLQTLSKADLITECIQLEKKVETLEKKVKDCKKRHKDIGSDNVAKMIDKIAQLQAQNLQLGKSIPRLPFQSDGASSSASSTD